ncbi:MAG: GNAT family N-acetyltransferase [Acidobacteria bacterium]|nr:GNAT family N-acetyltransferase [Acidobacteriota bacterium]
MPPPFTARLEFRIWRESDFPLALALWGDADVTRRIGGPFAADAVRVRLAREIDNEAQRGVQYWPIFLRDGGEHVGVCGLRPHEDILALGFHLHTRHQGKGLAREAAEQVIAHARDVLGVRALFAGHHPENEPSRALLGKLGFVYTHDAFYEPTGLMHPSYLLEV